MKKRTAKDTVFEPAPAGMTQGVCCFVRELPDQETKFGIKDLVRFYFETQVENEEGKRYIVSRTFNDTLGRGSNLRGFLESWGACKLADGEEVDLDEFVGDNATLNIVHSETERGIWANIDAIMPIAANAEEIKVRDFKVPDGWEIPF